MQNRLDVPILFMTFNRVAETQQVLDIIKKANPKKLYVSSDGPRDNNADDLNSTSTIRNLVLSQQMDCEVKTLFHTNNLGCKKAGITAIQWFFENEEKGIILEDDCLPSLNFFVFMQECLNKYEYDSRIVHINGNNFGYNTPSDYSYHFTYLPQVWGWGSWRRAWNKFDESMQLFDKFDDWSFYQHVGFSEADYGKARRKWLNAKNNRVEVWDYQWHFINLLEGNLVISPVNNLVSNIGFGANATHTIDNYSIKQNIERINIKLPIEHPPCLFVDQKLNDHYIRMMINEPLSYRFRRKLNQFRIQLQPQKR